MSSLYQSTESSAQNQSMKRKHEGDNGNLASNADYRNSKKLYSGQSMLMTDKSESYFIDRKGDTSPMGDVVPKLRENKLDKFFFDKKGDNSQMMDFTQKPGEKESTVNTLVSGTPSSTSFSAYVNSKADPRRKVLPQPGTLYRVHVDKPRNIDTSKVHSGITEDNVGVSSSVPSSPDARARQPAGGAQVDSVDVTEAQTSDTAVTGVRVDSQMPGLQPTGLATPGVDVSSTPVKTARRTGKKTRRTGAASDSEPDNTKQQKQSKGMYQVLTCKKTQ